MNKIVTIYIFNRKQNSVVWLASLVAITLLLLRVKITHSIHLLFLIWNLFLAFIPYFLSSNIYNNFFDKNKKIQNSIYAFTWLLFIPNTFYILTDFTHLHFINSFQFGLDMLILFSFSFAGFYIGLHSLHHIHQLIISKFGDKKGNLFILLISILSAFGIYLGRILRFNSWDIISKPIELFYKAIYSLFSLDTIIYTIQLSVIILTSYAIFYYWKQSNNNQEFINIKQ